MTKSKGKEMEKAARNETRKLTATYLNNIAVALLIAGIAIPLLSFLRSTPGDDVEWFKSFSNLNFAEAFQKASDIGVPLAAIVISILLHFIARRSLENVED
jgi:hypothetical protein